MKYPVTTTPGHQGKALEIDPAREIISLHGVNDALLGAVSWGEVIERIVNTDEDVRFSHARAHARAPLAVKVKYTTPEGKQFDSLTGGIGGGGLFIESSQPLAGIIASLSQAKSPPSAAPPPSIVSTSSRGWQTRSSPQT